MGSSFSFCIYCIEDLQYLQIFYSQLILPAVATRLFSSFNRKLKSIFYYNNNLYILTTQMKQKLLETHIEIRNLYRIKMQLSLVPAVI